MQEAGLVRYRRGHITILNRDGLEDCACEYYAVIRAETDRIMEIRRAEDIGPVFERIKGNADALHVCTDSLVYTNWSRINSLVLDARLPTMNGAREYVDLGGLISYGPNFLNLWRRAAELVDKILRGAKPGDLPVEQPTKFDLVINLTTAKALGLEVPPMLLARADEVIE